MMRQIRAEIIERKTRVRSKQRQHSKKGNNNNNKITRTRQYIPLNVEHKGRRKQTMHEIEPRHFAGTETVCLFGTQYIPVYSLN